MQLQCVHQQYDFLPGAPWDTDGSAATSASTMQDIPGSTTRMDQNQSNDPMRSAHHPTDSALTLQSRVVHPDSCTESDCKTSPAEDTPPDTPLNRLVFIGMCHSWYVS